MLFFSHLIFPEDIFRTRMWKHFLTLMSTCLCTNNSTETRKAVHSVPCSLDGAREIYGGREQVHSEVNALSIQQSALS